MMTEAELWNEVELFFQEQFDTEKNVTIETILFLIGVQELGSGSQKYTKDDKLNLIHIAVCRLLEPFGYYKFSHYDEGGFPHFDEVESLLMKKAIIHYFIDEKLFPPPVLEKIN